MAPITINGITFDPIGDAAVMRALGLEADNASLSNFVLVGIPGSGITSADQDEELQGLGMELHGYIAENTYLFRYKSASLDAIRRLDFVEWANVFMKQLKVNPALQSEQASGVGLQRQLLVRAVNSPAVNSTATQQVDAILHTGVAPDSDVLLDLICAAATVQRSDLTICRHKIRFSLPIRRLNDVAEIDDIRALLPVAKPELDNDVAREILQAHVVINDTAYTGEGQVACVADTGFDIGSTDPARMHPAFQGRVVRLYDLGRPGTSSDPHGHGTHVAGSLLGNGLSGTMGGYIRGTAPGALLVVQSAYVNAENRLGGIDALADLNDLFRPPYENEDARVHSNSWGYPLDKGKQLPYGYYSAASEIDEFVWEHQDMVICFSAGNNGTDALSPDGINDNRQIGATGAAKNCITVGASESIRLDHRPLDRTWGEFDSNRYPRDPLRSDLMSNSAEGMAALSSRGPTAENRIKPDVVAPGTSILSARSRVAPRPASTTYGTSSDPDWYFNTGTSMACPLVAGCAAVVRETRVKNGDPDPSAALVKAILINGAADLTGQYSPTEARPGPNDNSGWGRVNLTNSIVLPGPDPSGGDMPPFKKGDPPVVIPVHIPSSPPPRLEGTSVPEADALGIRTFKITLVWTDPPEQNGLLQNDLDLVVVAPDGRERYGNMGLSNGRDSVNNVEQVVWLDIPDGDAKVIVRPVAIRNGSQPWAYAWRLSW